MARRRMLAPIQSVKHYVSQTLSTVTNGTISVRPVTDAVVAPATGTTFDIQEGSQIKAVFIEIWVLGLGTAGQTSSFSFSLEKRPSNSPAMTFTNAANLGAYPNKKNILYTTQGITNSAAAGGTPVPVIRQWFAIPKGKQRQGLSDTIVINLANLGAIDLQICGIFTYKEYR